MNQPFLWTISGYIAILWIPAACGLPDVADARQTKPMLLADSSSGYPLGDMAAQPASEESPASMHARQLKRSATLTYEVEDDDERETIIKKVTALANKSNGYIASENRDGFVVRIPSDKLEVALDALGSFGKVIDRSSMVQDVTAEHLDLQIRIENMRALKERLVALLERADKVEDLLRVETELGRVTVELETLEGQMRLLRNQIELASIQVRFEDEVTPGPVGWIFYGLYHGIKWLFVWD